MTDEAPLSRDTPVQRLRAQLQGDALSGRSASRVPSSRGAGALLGAMLHGAARLDAGLELTDLESTLVGLLQGVVLRGGGSRDRPCVPGGGVGGLRAAAVSGIELRAPNCGGILLRKCSSGTLMFSVYAQILPVRLPGVVGVSGISATMSIHIP
jgi:hypothetical protein